LHENDVGLGEFFQRGLQQPIVHARHIPQQAVRETATDHRADNRSPAARFKHALIQDAAYENLLKSRRQVLHRRTGEVLRDQFAATAAAEPELLAHHFTQAGLTKVAVEWWGTAGQRSLARSAQK